VRLSEDEVTWLYLRGESLGSTTLSVVSTKYDPIIGLSQRHDRVDPTGAPRWSHIRSRAPAPQPHTEVEDAHVEFARGWPLRALAGRRLFSDRAFIHCGLVRGPVGAWREAVAVDLPALDSYLMHDGRALPLRPIWTGLAVDTVFWAGTWWMALLVPRRLRSAWRRLKNRCQSCGYDLRGHGDGGRSVRCPECGKAEVVP
jgi:hypothetical protein